jgi:hypothetical protein
VRRQKNRSRIPTTEKKRVVRYVAVDIMKMTNIGLNPTNYLFKLKNGLGIEQAKITNPAIRIMGVNPMNFYTIVNPHTGLLLILNASDNKNTMA